MRLPPPPPPNCDRRLAIRHGRSVTYGRAVYSAVEEITVSSAFALVIRTWIWISFDDPAGYDVRVIFMKDIRGLEG